MFYKKGEIMALKLNAGTILVAIIALALVYGVATGGFQLAAGGGVPSGVNIVTAAATVRASATNALTLATPANMNSVLVSTAGGTETQIATADVTAKGTAISTAAPNNFNGFYLIGNDNLAGGTTDRGAEFYYRKNLKSWSNQNTVELDDIKAYPEATTLTLAGLDDTTPELEDNTLSIAVGSGGTVDIFEVRLTIAADESFGNKDLPLSVGACINTTSTGLSFWDKDNTKPLAPAAALPIATPGFLTGYNVLGCYRITNALADEAGGITTFRFPWRLAALAGVDPGVTENITIQLIDESYYINDQQQWTTGFGDESVFAADTDIAADSRFSAATLLRVGIS